jgi:hypothetical protein
LTLKDAGRFAAVFDVLRARRGGAQAEQLRMRKLPVATTG